LLSRRRATRNAAQAAKEREHTVAEEKTEERIPVATDFNGALEWALTSRRGELLKIAGVPKASDLTDQDIVNLLDIMAVLIDKLHAEEVAVTNLTDIVECAKESLRGVSAARNEVKTKMGEMETLLKEADEAITRSRS